MVTVEQRRPGIVGDEIDLDRAEPRHVDGIFHHARRRLVAHLGDLEAVTMQMDRVVVAALVGHGEAIALALLGREQRVGRGPGLAVDGPAVVAAPASRHFLEDQIEPFIRRRDRPIRAEEGGRCSRRTTCRPSLLSI
jgi:hypothetical protein